MNPISALTERFRKRLAKKEADAFTPMNRRQRRAAGLRKPVGLLPAGLEVPQETQVPRYIMRHGRQLEYPQDVEKYVGHPYTRRMRKARARIMRIIVARGSVA